ncbi:MAG: M23 family metallopeptidase [Magnetococcus sp. WYHC-3]
MMKSNWLVTVGVALVLTFWAGPLAAARLSLSDALLPGRAVLMQVDGAPAQARFSVRFDGEAVPVSSDGRAILALDMDHPRHPVVLHVEINVPRKPALNQVLEQTLTVAARTYHTERINGLPAKKVTPDPEQVARAARENAAIKATYARRGGTPAYLDGFTLPAQGRFSGVFGSRRVLNGEARNPHNGVDIAAPVGTPIHAPSAGRVALVGHDYFYTGHTLVLDHGDGVITLYAHLDKIHVRQGDWVGKGQVVADMGKTGRVTGPHLHWGAHVRGRRVDPLMLPGIVATP